MVVLASTSFKPSVQVVICKLREAFINDYSTTNQYDRNKSNQIIRMHKNVF